VDGAWVAKCVCVVFVLCLCCGCVVVIVVVVVVVVVGGLCVVVFSPHLELHHGLQVSGVGHEGSAWRGVVDNQVEREVPALVRTCAAPLT